MASFYDLMNVIKRDILRGWGFFSCWLFAFLFVCFCFVLLLLLLFLWFFVFVLLFIRGGGVVGVSFCLV